MTRRKVLLSRTALRQLRNLPKDQERRVQSRLRVLEEDPFRTRSGADIRLLWGHDDPPLYRLTIGDYRILFFVVGDEVRITELLHRSKAYRGGD